MRRAMTSSHCPSLLAPVRPAVCCAVLCALAALLFGKPRLNNAQDFDLAQLQKSSDFRAYWVPCQQLLLAKLYQCYLSLIHI